MAFLHKKLDKSRAFVDNIWDKVKQELQYQLEDVQDQAAHLKYLQAILIRFDTDGAPDKPTPIRFFYKDLKPFIKAQIEQNGRELNSWEELIEKTIDVKAKSILQSPSSIRKIDQ